MDRSSRGGPTVAQVALLAWIAGLGASGVAAAVAIGPIGAATLVGFHAEAVEVALLHGLPGLGVRYVDPDHPGARDGKRIVVPGNEGLDDLEATIGLAVVALRHTMVTEALEAGVPVHVAQKMAGHASVTTTLAVYSHVRDKAMREAAEQLASRRRAKGGIARPDLMDEVGRAEADT